jgi:hypothetical protein
MRRSLPSETVRALVGVKAAVMGVALLLVSACGGNGKVDDDSAFAAVQERGRTAMGVDQYTSTHVFEDLPDGGRVVLDRDDASDTTGIRTIRDHMRVIEAAFRRGDFTLPGQVHARDVPGTDAMRERRDLIRYVAVDRPQGAEVRMTTTDSSALAAIRAFLAFQRSDHRAAGHDSH